MHTGSADTRQLQNSKETLACKSSIIISIIASLLQSRCTDYVVPFEVLPLACLYVCLPVCFSVFPLAYLNNHMSKFCEIFRTWYLSFSGDSAICYVKTWTNGLWVASPFYTMEPMGQNQRHHYVPSSSQGGDTGFSPQPGGR